MEGMDGVGFEETLAISEEQLLERHRRGDGVSTEDITSLLVTNQKLLVKNAVAKLLKESYGDSSSLALTGRRSTASGAIDGSESTVLVEAPTDEGASGVEAAARALLGSFPDATVEGSDTGLHASVAEPISSSNNGHEEEDEALALAAAHAAFAQWDAPGPQQQRQPLASLVASGALPRVASLGAWCRLAGAEKAATGGATLAELVLKADGPTGVPAGSRGLDGGPSEGTPGASVDSATRHRIRKDLQRSRCSVEFETTVDSDPMHGSLYRLLIAYACLDPQLGYVQGTNFIAALCLAAAKPDPPSSSGDGAEGASSTSSSSSDNSSSDGSSSSSSAGGVARASKTNDGPDDLAARRAAIEAEGTEAAFLLFTRMMQASGLRKVFDTQDDLLHTLILRLDWHLRGCLPSLHAHLEQEEVGATMFAVEWITTLFVYNVPFDTARALLGLFLTEGSMVGFVVPLGLAILAHLEAELLTRQFDTLVVHLKARLKVFTVGELLGAVRHLGRRMRFVRDYTTTPDTSLQQGSTAGGMAEGAMADGKNGGASGSGFSGVGFHGGIVGGLGGGHSSSSGSYGSANGEKDSGASAPRGGSSSGEDGVAAQLAHVVGSAADSREAWQRLKRSRWVPDDEAFRCANFRCMRYFNALSVRKHHCRACGRVYCGPCAATRAPLPLLAYKGELVRVCVPCTVVGAGAPAAWLFQEFQYQQQRNGGGGNAPSSALPQPSAGTALATTVTTAGAPLALPAKAWRQCLAYVCDAPVLSIPMLVELATPIAAHNDDDNSDDYGIRSSQGGGGADGPHESIGRAFLGRLGLPAMASPMSPRSAAAAAAAAAAGAGTGAVLSGEHGEGPHEDESNGVVVVGGGDGHPYLSHPANTSTAAGKALAHLFAPLGQGLGALQLPWSTFHERGSGDDDGWADGDLNGSLDLNSSSSVRAVPATVATRGRVLVASSAGSSSNKGAQGLGASAAAAAGATRVSVDEEQTLLTGGVADALLSSSPALSPAVGSGGSNAKSAVPLMGLDDNTGSSDPLDLEDVLASATEDFSRSAQALTSFGRRGSGLGDNTTMFFGGSGGAASLPDDFLEPFPLTSKGDPGLPSAHGEKGIREVGAPGARATAKQTPPPLPPPPKTLGASNGRAATAAGAAAPEAVQTGAHTRATAAATAGAPPPLPLPPRQFSSSPGSVNAPPPTSSPPVLPPPPKSIVTEAAAAGQPLVPPPLPPPPKIVVASQAGGSVTTETKPAAEAPVVSSSATASDSSDSSRGSSSNSSSDNGTASSSATTGSTQDNTSQGQSDVLSQPAAREGVASHVTAVLVDIFGKAPPPPLPNSRGVRSSRGPRSAEDVDKARESALAAELEALGRDFDVDDDYESLRAFANALDHGGSSPSGKVIANTTAAAAAGDLRDSKGSSLKSPSAGTEDLEDDIFGSTRPLPPPSADGALRSSFVDINAGDGDEDDFMEGGNWRQSIVRPGEGSGKGLFDFD